MIREIQEKDMENIFNNYTKLSDLYVSPQARDRGVGSKLIAKAIQWAKEKKTPEVILNVYEANKRAQALYIKNGFKEDGAISGGRIRMKQRNDV